MRCGDNLIARAASDAKPILIAGHPDAVWALGTLDVMPYRVRRRAALPAASYLAIACRPARRGACGIARWHAGATWEWDCLRGWGW